MERRKTSETAVSTGTAGDAAVYLIYGSDEYMVAERARDLVDRLCPPEHQAFGLEVIDGQFDSPGEIAAAILRAAEGVCTPGFMGAGKVVWLKELAAFETRESAELSEALARLTELIRSGVPSGQILLITARKVDGRSAFFKACQACGRIEVHDVPDRAREEQQYAERAAVVAFERLGVSMDEEALAEFLARVGTDTREITQEAEKLVIYLGNRKTATPDDVRAVVSATREAAVWDLTDAVGDRDLSRALAALQQLLFQGENEVGIITLLETRLRELNIFRGCLDRGWLTLRHTGRAVFANWKSSPEVNAALSALPKDPRNGNPFYVAKTAAQAAGFSAEELWAAQTLVLQTHQRLFNSALPTQTVLEFMVIKLLGGSTGATARHRAGRF